MAENTAIEWADATLNYVNGCSVYSPGCTNCYAMRLAGTRLRDHPSRAGLTQPSKAGPVWTGEVRAHEPALLQALKWQRPRRIFWNAHGDLFHHAVPNEWIDRQFAVCALTPQHTHLILTKRSARMREYVEGVGSGASIGRILDAMDAMKARGSNWYTQWPLANVWLGVSVEDQARADERIPDLLATPAAVRWISAEPLLGPLDLRPYLWASSQLEGGTPFPMHDGPRAGEAIAPAERLHWIVAGGESGPGARPMHPAWARSLRDQCAAAGVPFLFKQWGEWAPPEAFGATQYGPVADKDGGIGNWQRQYVVCGDHRADRLNAHSFTCHATDLVFQVGKRRAGRLLDGVLHDGYPA